MPKPLSMQALESSDFNEFWAEDRARQLMQDNGLTALGWSFKIGHSQKTLGWCKYREKMIEFSKHFVHLSRQEIEDTILHEIAHALVGPKHGHDHVWKAQCIAIGAKPQRLADEHIKSQAQYNYRVYCTSCGNSFLRYRLRPALLARYHCAKCGGRFDAERL